MNNLNLQKLESQLLLTSNCLFKQFEELKKQKVEATIDDYERQSRIEIEKQLAQQQHIIEREFEEAKRAVMLQLDQRRKKVQKSHEQCQRQVDNYNLILDDLECRKTAIESEYAQAISTVKQFKDRSNAEWKRKANEFIKKSCTVTL